MTATYFYLGPLTGVTLPDGAEVILRPRSPVSLPDGEYTRTLLAARYLVAGWSLGSVTGAAPDTWVVSEEIAANGFTGQTLISITGGEYSVNRGPWTSAIGTVINGDFVRVRVRSAKARSTVPAVGVLTIGEFSGAFSVTTLDDEPDAFAFVAQTGVAVSTDVVSNAITVTDVNVPVAIGVTGGSYAINGGAYTTAAGTVSQGDQVTVKVRSSSAPGQAATATLTIGDRSADFSVSTVAVDSSPADLAQYALVVETGSPKKTYLYVGAEYLLAVGYSQGGAGTAYGSFANDIAIVKFLLGGSVVRQFSVAISNELHPYGLMGCATVFDSTSIYISTQTHLIRLSHDGVLEWCVSIGLDGISNIAVDESGVYFIGNKINSGGYHLGKLDLDGSKLWLKKLNNHSSLYSVGLSSVFSSRVDNNLYIGGVTGNWTFHAKLSRASGALLDMTRHTNIGGDKTPDKFIDDPTRGVVWVNLSYGTSTNSYAGLLNLASGGLLSGQGIVAAEIYPGDAKAIVAFARKIQGLSLTSTSISPNLENSWIDIYNIQTSHDGGHTFFSGINVSPKGWAVLKLTRPVSTTTAVGSYGSITVGDLGSASYVYRPISFAGDYLPKAPVDDPSITVTPVSTAVTTQESHYVIGVMPHRIT
jgi:hypothetical protein